MQTTAQYDQTFEQRLARIDLTRVMAQIAAETGLSAEDLIHAEDLYRKFLTLVHHHPGTNLTPNRLADHVWHAHITFTRQYMSDCELLFGYYLHHGEISDVDPEGLAKSIEITNDLFERTFHYPMSRGLVPEHACMAGCSN